MTKYNAGDRVTFAHDDGSKLVDREVCVDVTGNHAAAVVFESLWNLSDPPKGWRVVSRKPKVELPNEPGIYIDAYESLWTLIDHLGWIRADREKQIYPLHEYAPFTRLLPVGSEREEAIRDVLKYIDDFGWTQYGRSTRMLKHFGIEK